MVLSPALLVRLRLGDRRRRPGGWAGPPPLLLLATVLGLLVAPMVGEDPPSAQPQATTVSHVVSSPPLTIEDPPVARRIGGVPASQGAQLVASARPLRLKPVHVGVASMNVFRKLSAAQAHRDIRSLTRRSGVDVVGWQEAERWGPALQSLRGWATRTFPLGKGRSELAVSWRSGKFRLVDARQRLVAYGVGSQDGRYPFGNRLVVVVTLEHRATGRLLTVINTHLPQAIEDLDRLGRWRPTINAFRARNQLERIAPIWRSAPGRWVVGTGDYNFDAGADARLRPVGGPRRVLARTAVSSYQALGTDVAPTFPENGRHIDYVFLDHDAAAQGLMKFTGHRVLRGFNSDHQPLVARLRLS